jgi:CxxC motif-containing protein (DUF1111 family)
MAECFWCQKPWATRSSYPFGDFLLHQIGTGDGIVQVGPEDTAAKLRKGPLWGLRTKSRFMHDLASLTLEDAITGTEGRRVASHTICGNCPRFNSSS